MRVHQFLIIEWIKVGKSLTVKVRIESSVLINKSYKISCVQTADNCTYFCTHVPKHFQFAQINTIFQSDVNKKLIVQRSELIVSEGFIQELSQSN